MKVFIPFLCYNHTCNTEWMMSMMKLILFLKDNNIPATVVPITFESLISRGRNAAAAMFLSDPSNTHLLFIDSDIQFEPEDVMRLLHANKPVVAAGYPQKWLSESALSRIYSSKEVPPNALQLATHIPIHLTPTTAISPVMEAEYATTGFLLIQRTVFETLMERFPEKHYKNDVDGYMSANPAYFFDFFPTMIHPETKRFESEDYGFSRLWRETGGKIYIVTDITLTHYGWYGFKGNLYRQLKVVQAQPAQ